MAGLAFEQAKEEIKRRTSLVQLMGEYIKLSKKGRDHVGLCPFHGEKSPSLHVHDAEGYYYCFGCHAKGDHYTFLMEHVGYSFGEAVRHLGERSGVEIEERTQDPRAKERRRERRALQDRFIEINEHANAAFRHMMDPTALSYLKERRGLTDETIEHFQLGFAPDAWDALSLQLQNAGFKALTDAAALGLVGARREGPGYYDKFRNRVIFPLREPLRGKIVGFAGRTLSTETDVPKYVNSSESELFSKGRNLYGLFEAKKQIRDDGTALVVEGQVDVLTMQQAGLPAVAPMGTALTEGQCDLLKRFADRVVLVYDGDSAGRAAAVKAVPLVLGAGLNGSVVLLPDGEDPDTLVRQQGRGALDALIERGKPLFEAYLEDSVASFDGTAAGRSGVIQRIAPVYALLESPAERDDACKKAAVLLGSLESEMKRWLMPARASAHAPQHHQGSQPPAGGNNAPQPERDLLGLLLRHSELIPFWIQRQATDAITNPMVLSIITQMTVIWEERGQFDMLVLLDWLSEQGKEAVASRLVAMKELDEPFGDEWQAAFVQISENLAEKVAEARLRARLSQMSQGEVLEFAQKNWSNV